MKKLTLFILAGIGYLGMNAQETNTWRWGVQLGMQGNKSQYIGGNANANARFHHNDYGSGSFSILGRYDFNPKWMIQSGIGVSGIGFEDQIAENYSFVNFSKRYTTISSKTAVFEIPLMGTYKFNPNCKNWKWFLSAGGAAVFTGNQFTQEVNNKGGDGNIATNISSETTLNKGGYVNIRFAAGREKVFQSGRIFSWSFIWNLGVSPMATNVVKYTIDNQNYEHHFSNNGNFFGFRLAYYLKPISAPTPVPSK